MLNRESGDEDDDKPPARIFPTVILPQAAHRPATEDDDIASYLRMIQEQSPQPSSHLQTSPPPTPPAIDFNVGSTLIPLTSPLAGAQDGPVSAIDRNGAPRLPLLSGGTFMPEETFITCCNPGIELVRVQSYNGQDSYMQRLRESITKMVPFFHKQGYILVASRVQSPSNRAIMYNKTPSQKNGQKYPRVWLVRRVNRSCTASRRACLLRLVHFLNRLEVTVNNRNPQDIGRFRVPKDYDETPPLNRILHLQDYITDKFVIAVIRKLFPDASTNWAVVNQKVSEAFYRPPFPYALRMQLGYSDTLVTLPLPVPAAHSSATPAISSPDKAAEPVAATARHYAAYVPRFNPLDDGTASPKKRRSPVLPSATYCGTQERGLFHSSPTSPPESSTVFVATPKVTPVTPMVRTTEPKDNITTTLGESNEESHIVLHLAPRFHKISRKDHFPHNLDPFLPLKERTVPTSIARQPKTTVHSPLPTRVHLPVTLSPFRSLATSLAPSALAAPFVDTSTTGDRVIKLDQDHSSQNKSAPDESSGPFVLHKYNSPPARKRKTPFLSVKHKNIGMYVATIVEQHSSDTGQLIERHASDNSRPLSTTHSDQVCLASQETDQDSIEFQPFCVQDDLPTDGNSRNSSDSHTGI